MKNLGLNDKQKGRKMNGKKALFMCLAGTVAIKSNAMVPALGDASTQVSIPFNTILLALNVLLLLMIVALSYVVNVLIAHYFPKQKSGRRKERFAITILIAFFLIAWTCIAQSNSLQHNNSAIDQSVMRTVLSVMIFLELMIILVFTKIIILFTRRK